MTDDQAQPAPDPTCNCGHSVVQHHFHGTHGCRVCNCGSFSRPAPPTEREERGGFIGVGGLAHAAGFNVGTKPETHPTGDPATDTISYLLDVLDMYDERLAETDGEEKVYTARHKAGKQRARECLDWLRRLRTHSPEEPADLAPKHDREAILSLIADDARRIEAGEPSVCAGCEKEIASRQHVYRCTECGLPFHLPCARVHFRDSADASPEEPVGYVVARGNHLESRKTVSSLDDARELLRRHNEEWFPNLTPKAVIRPIGQPLDSEGSDS